MQFSQTGATVRVNALMIVALFAAIMLGWVFYSQANALKGTLSEQQKRIHELEAKLVDKVKADNLALQERCSKRGQEEFKSFEADGYTTHYNAELNKCFILIESTKTVGYRQKIYRGLFDAYERKIYGTYVWLSEPDKKYWEVTPYYCEMTLQSGQKASCKSSEEFDTLIETYMK